MERPLPFGCLAVLWTLPFECQAVRPLPFGCLAVWWTLPFECLAAVVDCQCRSWFRTRGLLVVVLLELKKHQIKSKIKKANLNLVCPCRMIVLQLLRVLVLLRWCRLMLLLQLVLFLLLVLALLLSVSVVQLLVECRQMLARTLVKLAPIQGRCFVATCPWACCWWCAAAVDCFVRLLSSVGMMRILWKSIIFIWFRA